MSRMVNLLVLPHPQQRLPVLASLYPCRLPTIHTRSANSVSESQRKWNIGFKAPRRLVLGLGASFWSQFMSMAGRARSKHLIALAKQEGVIEEVNFLSLLAAVLYSFTTRLLNLVSGIS